MRVSAATPIVRRPAATPAARTAAPQTTPAPLKTPARTGIEVDVNGQVDAEGALAATGTVKLERAFMERLIRHVTRKPHAFGERNVSFDPKTGTYGGTVQVKIKGHPITLVARAVPVVDANQPGFQFQDLGIKLGGFTLKAPFFKNLAAKLIAKEITGSGIQASAGEKGIVRLDPTSLLYDVEVLPYSMRIDPAKTKFTVQMSPTGDVRVGLSSPTPTIAGADTERSDLAASIDEKGLAKVLKPILGNDYQLSGVTIRQGGLTLEGMVEAKPLSDLINIGKTLIGIIAIGSGRRDVNMDAEKAMIKLKIDVKLNGTQATLTPDLGPAVGELEKTLTKAGLTYVREGKSLKVDFGPLLAPYGIESVEAVPGALKGKARLDINGLIKAPILRGIA